jgi:hypothetical protein
MMTTPAMRAALIGVGLCWSGEVTGSSDATGGPFKQSVSS